MNLATRARLARLSVVGAASSFAAAAHAALPDGVDAALTSAKTDTMGVATTVFVIIVGIFAIKLLRRGL